MSDPREMWSKFNKTALPNLVVMLLWAGDFYDEPDRTKTGIGTRFNKIFGSRVKSRNTIGPGRGIFHRDIRHFFPMISGINLELKETHIL